MKLAILSDIHSNLRAFEAVIADVEAWQPDQVFVTGDIVNRGPMPRECMELLLKKIDRHGWRTLLGNHDQYVLQQSEPKKALDDFDKQIFKHSQWTAQKMNSQLPELRAMPLSFNIQSPTKSPIHFTHASMAGIDKGVRSETTDEEMATLFQPGYELIFVGHTHRPLMRSFNGSTVVNVGSVGLPFDRDIRAAYARVEWTGQKWQIEIIRIEYDIDRAKQDFLQTGFIDQGPMPQLIYDEICNARPRLSQWDKKYKQQVKNGEISFDESIEKLLNPADM